LNLRLSIAKMKVLLFSAPSPQEIKKGIPPCMMGSMNNFMDGGVGKVLVAMMPVFE